MRIVQLLRSVLMTIAGVCSGCHTNAQDSDRQTETCGVIVLDPFLAMAGPFLRQSSLIGETYGSCSSTSFIALIFRHDYDANHTSERR